MNTPTPLDPAIARCLDAFAWHRRRLILRRGLYAVAGVLPAVMILMAVLDRFVLLEDTTRYAISAFGWALVAVVFWHTCLRHLVRHPRREDIARMVENAEPALREDLLSTVELGDGTQPDAWDSPEFRAILHRDVATRLADLDVGALLPVTLLRRWARIAVAVAILTVVLLLVPGLEFYRPFLRVLIPVLNVARVSHTQIAIHSPEPADTIVPRGDIVSVVVELSGAPADSARLETLQGGQRDMVPMKQIGARRYTADLDIGNDDVRYRVRAGDAMTRTHRLRAIPSPGTVRFVKIYRYPPYLGWEDHEVSEDGGVLEGPQGTRVDLLIEVDQPVSEAALHIDAGSAVRTVALNPGGEETLRGSLTLEASGTYHVALRAHQTGFENRYRPEYEIAVQADQVPSVEIVRPAGERVVTPDDVLEMEVTACDDLGLVNIRQQVRVNRGPWRDLFAQDIDGATEASAEHAWDLLDEDLKVGDRLLTRYVATDGKGREGESAVVRLTVGSRLADPGADPALQVMQEIARDLDAIGQQARSLHQAATETREFARDDHAGQPGLRRQQLQLAAAAERTRELVKRAADALRDGIPEMDQPLAMDDLATAGQVLSRMDSARLEPGMRALEQARPPDAAEPDRDRMDAAARELDEAAQAGMAVARDFDAIVAAEEARSLRDALGVLRDEQHAVREEAEETSRRRAARRQEAVEVQLGHMAEALDELHARGGNQRGEINRARNNLSRMDERLADPARAEETPFDPDLARELDETLERAADRMARVARQLARPAEEARGRLREQAGSAMADVRDAGQALQSLDRSVRSDAPAGEQAAARAEAEYAVDTAAAMLNERADWEERSSRGQDAWGSDLDRAARAMAAVRPVPTEEAEVSAAVDQARTLEEILRDLAMGEVMEDTGQTAARLSGEERWGTTEEADERASTWRDAAARPNEAARSLRDSDLPESAVREFADAMRGESARGVNREMEARVRELEHRPGSQADALTDIADQIAEARADADPALAEARRRLAEISPSLGEQLASLGDDAQTLAADTAEAAEAPQTETAEALLQRQEVLTEQVNQARGALRREALAQDLGAAEGRERARDSDDALAMLEGAPESAEQSLREAVAAPLPARAQAPLAQASQEQSRLADALQDFSQHYRPDTAGESTREALRSREEPLGVAEELDARYSELERLADLMTLDPAAATDALEAELLENAAMREELGNIARSTVEQAADTVRRTAEGESDLAGAIDEARSNAQPSGNPSPEARGRLAGNQEALTRQAQQAAEDLGRAALQQARLGREPTSPLEQISDVTRAIAGNEMSRTADMLMQGAPAERASPVAAQAARGLHAQANALDQVLETYPPPAGAAPGTPTDPAGAWMARALDRLDAAANGDPAALSPSLTPANALAQAARAQAQSLAQSRIPGEVASAAPASGAPVDVPATAAVRSLPAPALSAQRAWAALPERLARQLRTANREKVPEAYRDRVNAYFSRIAEEGRD